MQVLLDALLPRLFPSLTFHCVPHEGKADLEKSIPRKLRSWTEPGARFVIVRDKDGGDCLALKERLRSLSAASHRSVLIRIPCWELEAWYLGDPAALARAFADPALAGIGAKARFRDPDAVTTPSKAMEALVPSYQKISGARAMAKEMTRETNASRSFQVFVEGIEREMKALGLP